jgi:hypothetical protein
VEITKLTASLCVNIGPPFRSMNGRPSSSICAVMTSPAFCDGVSAGVRWMFTIRLFGTSEVRIRGVGSLCAV